MRQLPHNDLTVGGYLEGQDVFKPAVSLTYDGGDPSHWEVVRPTLAGFGLKGTFYLPNEVAIQTPGRWTKFAESGHELGSHSLMGVTDEFGNLPNWTLENVEADLQMASKLLRDLFPMQDEGSFAYPGTQTGCVASAYDRHPASYRECVRRQFRFAKSRQADFNIPATFDPTYLRNIPAAGLTAQELIALATNVLDSKKWLILSFEGVGAGPNAVDRYAHEALCKWIAEHRGQVECPTICTGAIERISAGTSATKVD